MILTEDQRELKRDLRNFKADYYSADAEDVIRALRKRQRGLNEQVKLDGRFACSIVRFDYCLIWLCVCLQIGRT